MVRSDLSSMESTEKAGGCLEIHLAFLLAPAMNDDSVVGMGGQVGGRLLSDAIRRAGDQNRSFER